MMDEVYRALFGMITCYPVLRMLSHYRVKPGLTTVLVTLWTVPIWKLYSWLVA